MLNGQCRSLGRCNPCFGSDSCACCFFHHYPADIGFCLSRHNPSQVEGFGLSNDAVRRKIGLALGAVLLICGWRACVYDRATWYGERHRGKLMANGLPFNPDALTAASWNYPLGSRLKVAYKNRNVIVEVTDRGGVRSFMQFGKVVDLSHAAFERLEKPAVGSIRVSIARVEREDALAVDAPFQSSAKR